MRHDKGMRGITTQLIRQLTTAANRRTDGDLLDGFLTRNTEADFAELVSRYGAMVWNVCRRVLPDPADAEDAFQSVFLVLVRRGHKLVGLPTVGPWLHRVTVWTARNIRRRNAYRLSRRVTLSEETPATPISRDLSLDLDDALLALPEKFRSSIVLCHLLGFSRADAAAQLGCPEGTLSAWLSRGLARLRTRLADLDPARTLGIAAVALPMGLSVSVVRAAVAFHATAATTTILSSAISQLVEGVIRMFWVKKTTAATVALFAVFAFGVGVGVSTHQLAPASGGQDDKVLLKSEVQTKPTDGLDAIAEESDIDKLLAELEDQMKATLALLRSASEGLKLTEQKVALDKLAVSQGKLDRKDLDQDLETLARFQKNVDDATKKMGALKKTLLTLREYKLQLENAKPLKAKLKQDEPPANPDPKAKALKAPPVADDIDKGIAELKKMQLESRLKSEAAEDAVQKLRRELKAIEQKLAALEDQKQLKQKLGIPPSPNATGGLFQLTVGPKEAAWPFLIKEFGPDKKPIGTTAFDNTAALGRFIARAMKDSTAPKEVQIIAQANTPPEMLALAIDTCKANAVPIAGVLAEKAGLLEKRAKEAFDLDVPKAKDSLKKVTEELDELGKIDRLKWRENVLDERRKLGWLEDLNRQAEKERIYRDAIREARELLKKQKQDDPPKP